MGALIGGTAAWGAEAVRVIVGSNCHCVVRGRIYRSAQPGAMDLRWHREHYGIRTVLNLRGLSPDFTWYTEETRAAHELGICQEDITLSANRLPPPQELRRLVEVLDRAEYPVLVHCRRGSDRTGLVSALALLLYTDADVPAARIQCSPRYGHLRVLSTARMDEFFDYYEAWLAARQARHSPERFRHWVLQQYSPGPAAADLELVGALPQCRVGDLPNIRVRAWNRSHEVWQLHPGTHSGVHIRFIVFGPDGRAMADERTGFFEAAVAPGASVEVTLALPRLEAPGRYGILVDPEGPHHTSFLQEGSKPLDLELDVRE